MRKLILSMQVSLDGFIAGPGGDMSWMIQADSTQWADVFEMLQSVDLFLLGRVMWPEYRDHWKSALSDPTAPADEVAYAKIAEKGKHIIFSSTLEDPGWENATIVKGAVAEEVAKIKQGEGRDIYAVGGAKLAATLTSAGLVDEYRLTFNPVILGEGKSFFRDQTSKQNLELISTKALASGVFIAKYRVKNT